MGMDEERAARDGARTDLAALRARMRAAPRRPWRAVLGLALAALVAGAGAGLAHDDAGILTFFREEAARRLPAPVAAVVAAAPRPAQGPARVARAEPRRETPRGPRVDPVPRAASVATAAASVRPSTGRTACVRLCDGYHFPLGPIASAGDRPVHQAACEAACPHARVALFTLAPGVADIGGARGPDGILYRALPQAFAHQSRRVADCSCQGPDNVARRIDPAADRTLRRGDLIVGRASAQAYAGRAGAFEDFRRSRALSPVARRQVDALLAVSVREARREAFLRTMTVVRVEASAAAPGRSAAFAPVERSASGFGTVRVVASSPFVAIN
ncbi:MAG TPA: DUF2865 domain-containing protein [Salinarimonas sp.]|nr:DUF2865 domain-containing protein [Salinarimonas sp.]